jgi:hypothetical protein
VLYDLQYPESIVETTRNVLSSLWLIDSCVRSTTFYLLFDCKTY